MTTVGFYVKAGTKTGYGHLIRCYALAGELKERGCECVFWTNQPAWCKTIVRILSCSCHIERRGLP
jgi:spore coat polysaccharide biosynthesis predicted glycosyltransferase SpsG